MLVKDGWCWWYRKYAPGDTALEGLEMDARQARIGLWANPQPVRLGVAEEERALSIGVSLRRPQRWAIRSWSGFSSLQRNVHGGLKCH